jgi:hypothetical protein
MPNMILAVERSLVANTSEDVGPGVGIVILIRLLISILRSVDPDQACRACGCQVLFDQFVFSA